VLDRLRPALGLSIVALAVLLAGCGGASKPTASTDSSASVPAQSASVTKARFVTQAEVICRALLAQQKPLEARQEQLKSLPSPTIDTAFVALVHKVVADSRAAEGKLAALERPTADSQAIKTLLSAFSEEIFDANGIAKAANLQEATLGELAAKDLSRSVEKNKALAAEYGMRDCIGAE
jgi:hypothetical protein